MLSTCICREKGQEIIYGYQHSMTSFIVGLNITSKASVKTSPKNQKNGIIVFLYNLFKTAIYTYEMLLSLSYINSGF